MKAAKGVESLAQLVLQPASWTLTPASLNMHRFAWANTDFLEHVQVCSRTYADVPGIRFVEPQGPPPHAPPGPTSISSKQRTSGFLCSHTHQHAERGMCQKEPWRSCWHLCTWSGLQHGCGLRASDTDMLAAVQTSKLQPPAKLPLLGRHIYVTYPSPTFSHLHATHTRMHTYVRAGAPRWQPCGPASACGYP